jgi:hypothetical protein
VLPRQAAELRLFVAPLCLRKSAWFIASVLPLALLWYAFSMSTVQVPARPAQEPERPSVARLRIDLPLALVEAYEQQAARLRIPVEELLAMRLRDCLGHTASRPLYFNDEQRKMLEKLAGHMLRTPEEALQRLAQGFQVLLGDTVIELDADTARRIPALLHSPKRTKERFLLDAVRRAVGLIQ